MWRTPRRCLRASAGRPRLRGQDRGDRQHPGQRFDGLLGGFAQRFEARAALGLDLDRKADIAVADDDARYHPERDDVPGLVGIAHRGQRVEDLSLGDCHSLFPRFPHLSSPRVRSEVEADGI